ncbi:Os03g0229801, partial [Oryza sativa Japonica Group]
ASSTPPLLPPSPPRQVCLPSLRTTSGSPCPTSTLPPGEKMGRALPDEDKGRWEEGS